MTSRTSREILNKRARRVEAGGDVVTRGELEEILRGELIEQALNRSVGEVP